MSDTYKGGIADGIGHGINQSDQANFQEKEEVNQLVLSSFQKLLYEQLKSTNIEIDSASPRTQQIKLLEQMLASKKAETNAKNQQQSLDQIPNSTKYPEKAFDENRRSQSTGIQVDDATLNKDSQSNSWQSQFTQTQISPTGLDTRPPTGVTRRLSSNLLVRQNVHSPDSSRVSQNPSVYPGLPRSPSAQIQYQRSLLSEYKLDRSRPRAASQELPPLNNSQHSPNLQDGENCNDRLQKTFSDGSNQDSGSFIRSTQNQSNNSDPEKNTKILDQSLKCAQYSGSNLPQRSQSMSKNKEENGNSQRKEKDSAIEPEVTGQNLDIQLNQMASQDQAGSLKGISAAQNSAELSSPSIVIFDRSPNDTIDIQTNQQSPQLGNSQQNNREITNSIIQRQVQELENATSFYNILYDKLQSPRTSPYQYSLTDLQNIINQKNGTLTILDTTNLPWIDASLRNSGSQNNSQNNGQTKQLQQSDEIKVREGSSNRDLPDTNKGPLSYQDTEIQQVGQLSNDRNNEDGNDMLQKQETSQASNRAGSLQSHRQTYQDLEQQMVQVNTSPSNRGQSSGMDLARPKNINPDFNNIHKVSLQDSGHQKTPQAFNTAFANKSDGNGNKNVPALSAQGKQQGNFNLAGNTSSECQNNVGKPNIQTKWQVPSIDLSSVCNRRSQEQEHLHNQKAPSTNRGQAQGSQNHPDSASLFSDTGSQEVTQKSAVESGSKVNISGDTSYQQPECAKPVFNTEDNGGYKSKVEANEGEARDISKFLNSAELQKVPVQEDKPLTPKQRLQQNYYKLFESRRIQRNQKYLVSNENPRLMDAQSDLGKVRSSQELHQMQLDLQQYQWQQIRKHQLGQKSDRQLNDQKVKLLEMGGQSQGNDSSRVQAEKPSNKLSYREHSENDVIESPQLNHGASKGEECSQTYSQENKESSQNTQSSFGIIQMLSSRNYEADVNIQSQNNPSRNSGGVFQNFEQQAPVVSNYNKRPRIDPCNPINQPKCSKSLQNPKIDPHRAQSQGKSTVAMQGNLDRHFGSKSQGQTCSNSALSSYRRALSPQTPSRYQNQSDTSSDIRSSQQTEVSLSDQISPEQSTSDTESQGGTIRKSKGSISESGKSWTSFRKKSVAIKQSGQRSLAQDQPDISVQLLPTNSQVDAELQKASKNKMGQPSDLSINYESELDGKTKNKRSAEIRKSGSEQHLNKLQYLVDLAQAAKSGCINTGKLQVENSQDSVLGSVQGVIVPRSGCNTSLTSITDSKLGDGSSLQAKSKLLDDVYKFVNLQNQALARGSGRNSVQSIAISEPPIPFTLEIDENLKFIGAVMQDSMESQIKSRRSHIMRTHSDEQSNFKVRRLHYMDSKGCRHGELGQANSSKLQEQTSSLLSEADLEPHGLQKGKRSVPLGEGKDSQNSSRSSSSLDTQDMELRIPKQESQQERSQTDYQNSQGRAPVPQQSRSSSGNYRQQQDCKYPSSEQNNQQQQQHERQQYQQVQKESLPLPVQDQRQTEQYYCKKARSQQSRQPGIVDNDEGLNGKISLQQDSSICSRELTNFLNTREEVQNTDSRKDQKRFNLKIMVEKYNKQSGQSQTSPDACNKNPSSQQKGNRINKLYSTLKSFSRDPGDDRDSNEGSKQNYSPGRNGNSQQQLGGDDSAESRRDARNVRIRRLGSNASSMDSNQAYVFGFENWEEYYDAQGQVQLLQFRDDVIHQGPQVKAVQSNPSTVAKKLDTPNTEYIKITLEQMLAQDQDSFIRQDKSMGEKHGPEIQIPADVKSSKSQKDYQLALNGSISQKKILNTSTEHTGSQIKNGRIGSQENQKSANKNKEFLRASSYLRAESLRQHDKMCNEQDQKDQIWSLGHQKSKGVDVSEMQGSKLQNNQDSHCEQQPQERYSMQESLASTVNMESGSQKQILPGANLLAREKCGLFERSESSQSHELNTQPLADSRHLVVTGRSNQSDGVQSIQNLVTQKVEPQSLKTECIYSQDDLQELQESPDTIQDTDMQKYVYPVHQDSSRDLETTQCNARDPCKADLDTPKTQVTEPLIQEDYLPQERLLHQSRSQKRQQKLPHLEIADGEPVSSSTQVLQDAHPADSPVIQSPNMDQFQSPFNQQAQSPLSLMWYPIFSPNTGTYQFQPIYYIPTQQQGLPQWSQGDPNNNGWGLSSTNHTQQIIPTQVMDLNDTSSQEPQKAQNSIVESRGAQLQAQDNQKQMLLNDLQPGGQGSDFQGKQDAPSPAQSLYTCRETLRDSTKDIQNSLKLVNLSATNSQAKDKGVQLKGQSDRELDQNQSRNQESNIEKCGDNLYQSNQKRPVNGTKENQQLCRNSQNRVSFQSIPSTMNCTQSGRQSRCQSSLPTSSSSSSFHSQYNSMHYCTSESSLDSGRDFKTPSNYYPKTQIYNDDVVSKELKNSYSQQGTGQAQSQESQDQVAIDERQRDNPKLHRKSPKTLDGQPQFPVSDQNQSPLAKSNDSDIEIKRTQLYSSFTDHICPSSNASPIRIASKQNPGVQHSNHGKEGNNKLSSTDNKQSNHNGLSNSNCRKSDQIGRDDSKQRKSSSLHSQKQHKDHASISSQGNPKLSHQSLGQSGQNHAKQLIGAYQPSEQSGQSHTKYSKGMLEVPELAAKRGAKQYCWADCQQQKETHCYKQDILKRQTKKMADRNPHEEPNSGAKLQGPKNHSRDRPTHPDLKKSYQNSKDGNVNDRSKTFKQNPEGSLNDQSQNKAKRAQQNLDRTIGQPKVQPDPSSKTDTFLRKENLDAGKVLGQTKEGDSQPQQQPGELYSEKWQEDQLQYLQYLQQQNQELLKKHQQQYAQMGLSTQDFGSAQSASSKKLHVKIPKSPRAAKLQSLQRVENAVNLKRPKVARIASTRRDSNQKLQSFKYQLNNDVSIAKEQAQNQEKSNQDPQIRRNQSSLISAASHTSSGTLLPKQLIDSQNNVTKVGENVPQQKKQKSISSLNSQLSKVSSIQSKMLQRIPGLKTESQAREQQKESNLPEQAQKQANELNFKIEGIPFSPKKDILESDDKCLKSVFEANDKHNKSASSESTPLDGNGQNMQFFNTLLGTVQSTPADKDSNFELDTNRNTGATNTPKKQIQRQLFDSSLSPNGFLKYSNPEKMQQADHNLQSRSPSTNQELIKTSHQQGRSPHLQVTRSFKNLIKQEDLKSNFKGILEETKLRTKNSFISKSPHRQASSLFSLLQTHQDPEVEKEGGQQAGVDNNNQDSDLTFRDGDGKIDWYKYQKIQEGVANSPIPQTYSQDWGYIKKQEAQLGSFNDGSLEEQLAFGIYQGKPLEQNQKPPSSNGQLPNPMDRSGSQYETLAAIRSLNQKAANPLETNSEFNYSEYLATQNGITEETPQKSTNYLKPAKLLQRLIDRQDRNGNRIFGTNQQQAKSKLPLSVQEIKALQYPNLDEENYKKITPQSDIYNQPLKTYDNLQQYQVNQNKPLENGNQAVKEQQQQRNSVNARQSQEQLWTTF